MLCNGDFSFLPLPLVSSVKDQSSLPKSLLVGGQSSDRVMFCLKPFDFNDFRLKMTKYLMFPNSHFCEIELPQQNSTSCICTSLPLALHNLFVVNQIVDKNPLIKILFYCTVTKSIHRILNTFPIQFN